MSQLFMLGGTRLLSINQHPYEGLLFRTWTEVWSKHKVCGKGSWADSMMFFRSFGRYVRVATESKAPDQNASYGSLPQIRGCVCRADARGRCSSCMGCYTMETQAAWRSLSAQPTQTTYSKRQGRSGTLEHVLRTLRMAFSASHRHEPPHAVDSLAPLQPTSDSTRGLPGAVSSKSGMFTFSRVCNNIGTGVVCKSGHLSGCPRQRRLTSAGPREVGLGIFLLQRPGELTLAARTLRTAGRHALEVAGIQIGEVLQRGLLCSRLTPWQGRKCSAGKGKPKETL